MTSQEYYEAYTTTLKNIEVAKTELKTLWSGLESTARTIRKNTVGSFAEKMAAVQTAIAPIKAAIAETEQTIAKMQAESDEQWNDYHKAEFC